MKHGTGRYVVGVEGRTPETVGVETFQTTSWNMSIARMLCFHNLLQAIQITHGFPITKSIARSFKWTSSWAFKPRLFSELPWYGRKLIQCSFIHCACRMRSLNGRQSLLLQSEILRRISSINFYFFQSQGDASLPLWDVTEGCKLSHVAQKWEERCMKDVKVTVHFSVWNDRHPWVSQHHPASPVTTW